MDATTSETETIQYHNIPDQPITVLVTSSPPPFQRQLRHCFEDATPAEFPLSANPSIVLHVLTSYNLDPQDLAKLEATSSFFRQPAGFAPDHELSLAELAALDMCHNRAIFKLMTGDERLELKRKCGGSWKLVLQFFLAGEAGSRREKSQAIAGPGHSIVVTSKGVVYSFGSNNSGQLGHGTIEEDWRPRQIRSVQGIRIIQAADGAGRTILISDAGQVYAFRRNAFGEAEYGVQGSKLVASCFLVVEHRSRIFRGFAFIIMDNVEDANCCIKHLNQSVLEGRYITMERQNPLETLGLLVGTTREFEYVEDEFVELAIDGKVVEFAAMLTVANRKLYDIKGEVYEIIEGSIHDKDSTPNVESVHWLLRVFDDVGHHITKYIKEDKYNVTKYQAIEDVTCMLQGTDLAPLELSDTDLSVYSWYRDEEPSYPSEAPYENVRLLHDVGMAHYSKSGFRWEVSYKELYTWRSAKTKAYIKEMENELAHLKEENAIQKKQLQKANLKSNSYCYSKSG